MTDDLIQRAAALLRAGRLVAFPTETVYGLGADATNCDAVGRVFAAKGRPATNPLIVHVADVEAAKLCASAWPEIAQRLATAFWPGPLTLVVRRASRIVDEVTAGGETVGLRVPDHPVALAMLRAFGGAVAAPSANRSNRISPTTAEHVRRELHDAVDLVLDGGPCRVGIESTVVDLTAPQPVILRQGHITAEQLAQVIGPVRIGAASASHDAEIERSPGRLRVHYAPKAPAYAFSEEDRSQIRQWAAVNLHTRTVFLLLESADPVATTHGWHQVITILREPDSYARALYAALHSADAAQPDVIWIERPPETPLWSAVIDRITRATRPAREFLSSHAS